MGIGGADEPSGLAPDTATARACDEARAVPGVTALEISILPGRPVRPLPEGDRYLGFLFARASSPAEVEDALRTAHAHLHVVINGV